MICIVSSFFSTQSQFSSAFPLSHEAGERRKEGSRIQFWENHKASSNDMTYFNVCSCFSSREVKGKSIDHLIDVAYISRVFNVPRAMSIMLIRHKLLTQRQSVRTKNP